MPKNVKEFWDPFLKSKIAIDVEVQIFTFKKWYTFQICQIGVAKCDNKSRDTNKSPTSWNSILIFQKHPLFHHL
jgi:hypothetical protein